MITINSFGVELTKDERAKLYPRCGKLYPDGLSQLAKAEEYDQVRIIAESYAVKFFNLFKYDSKINIK
jgi:V-type H+-transporting ATPase subunit d